MHMDLLNTPHNCIAPEGRKIIFVNGYLGLGSPKGGETHSMGGAFAEGIMQYLKEHG